MTDRLGAITLEELIERLELKEQEMSENQQEDVLQNMNYQQD